MHKTQKEVIEDLKALFNVSDFENRTKNEGFESEGKFYINKSKMHKGSVVQKLEKYFNDTKVKDCYCSIDPICLLFTTFSIVNNE